jgi:hypothetical protein
MSCDEFRDWKNGSAFAEGWWFLFSIERSSMDDCGCFDVVLSGNTTKNPLKIF